MPAEKGRFTNQNTKINIRSDLKYYEDLTQKEYIEDRLIGKIRLYYKFSRRCERAYRFVVFSTLTFGALVPICLNWDYLNDTSGGEGSNLGITLSTIFSIVVIILVALVTTFKWRERLQNYKKTEDELTHELFLFQSKTEPYHIQNDTNNFKLLVFRTESIIRNERGDTIEKVTSHIINNDNLNQPK